MSEKSKIEVDEVKKLSFWFSQFFVIAATVIGVFLAANQGFKQALEFSNIQDAKSNYYLRLSLQNEIQDNIAYIREFSDKVDIGIVNPTLNLERFVWDTMKYSSYTLETPSELLRDTQKFFRKADEIVNTGYLPIGQKAKQLRTLADDAEKELLPKFKKNTEELEKDLNKKKVIL